ncbi:MAG: anthranilate phosphoribosyltransferase [Actinomycetota bacterium]|nr:anthranilate phosphoribosyltransferase [Actinomycetota bacterium]MDH5278256.1 anthranilate phosphoribosyltransferase [Actinomycetota bacterium]
MDHSWPTVLTSLLRGEPLHADQAAWAMGQVMAGDATPAQVAAFAVALRAKGETADEMAGLVTAMLDHARRIEVPGPVVDVVGTGGDRSHSVNISTMAALVAAGAGARVVKHGNRAATSSCGSADVLEELGVRLALTPAQVAEVATEVGITFCFAQVFHPAMRHAAAARKEIGVPTAFNFLGPLTNPAQPAAQAVGCADERMAGVMAEVFAKRGVSALVFRGDDGLDELTVSTTSSVWVVEGGEVTRTALAPGDLGIALAPLSALRGGDREFNAAAVRSVLSGEEVGPIRDAVLLNAAAALAALEAVPGASDAGGADEEGGASGARPRPDVDPLSDRLARGMARAAESVDTGAAADTLDRWVAATQARSTP